MKRDTPCANTVPRGGKRRSRRADFCLTSWLSAPRGSREQMLFLDAQDLYLAAQECSGRAKEVYAKRALRRFRAADRLRTERLREETKA